MRILAISTGAITQDILLLDTQLPVEHCIKMVMPAATELAARRIRRATREGRPVLLTGMTIGSGPCRAALEAHLSQGSPAYATEQAARTFDDDLAVVRAMGVTVVSDDEGAGLRGIEHVVMRDLDLPAIRGALSAFAVSPSFDGLALGCLDHGTPPPGIAARRFRFDHLCRLVKRRPDLTAFALRPEETPPYLSRAQSILDSRDADIPTVFMDTGAAAALGSLLDPSVTSNESQVLMHAGNLHALAFHTSGSRIHALFEHHTDELDDVELLRQTSAFIAGELDEDDVWRTQGHGVHYVEPVEGRDPVLVLTGAQRSRLQGGALRPYIASPLGDTGFSGCTGLLLGFAARFPDAGEQILHALPAPSSARASLVD